MPAVDQQAHIRTATSDDVAALAALGAETFRDTFASANDPGDMADYLARAFAPDRIHAELGDPASIYLLAFADPDAAPIGYVKLSSGPVGPSVQGPKPVELSRLYVRREAIGTGLGAALMRASLDAARARGYETVWLGVWEHNPRAIAFYRKWGFDTVGSHDFVLGSDRQTDLIMQRSVPSAP